MVYKSPLMVETHYNKSFDDMDLHAFIPDELALEQSVNNFIKIRSERRRYNREFWILDISAWSTPFHASEAIAKSSLDFDDELYFYTQQKEADETSIILWEHYEIHPSKPRKVFSFGIWTSARGLEQQTKESKFERRRNFEVQ